MARCDSYHTVLPPKGQLGVKEVMAERHPAAIHGADMSGLAALSAGASAIRFDYVPLPTGGQITYTTSDQALITALHAWFGAQVTDHGHDATGHDGTHP